MVFDSKSVLDSMAGLTLVNPPDIGLLAPGSFPHRFSCCLLTLARWRTLHPCQVLLEPVFLFADISSDDTFEVRLTRPSYPSWNSVTSLLWPLRMQPSFNLKFSHNTWTIWFDHNKPDHISVCTYEATPTAAKVGKGWVNKHKARAIHGKKRSKGDMLQLFRRCNQRTIASFGSFCCITQWLSTESRRNCA